MMFSTALSFIYSAFCIWAVSIFLPNAYAQPHSFSYYPAQTPNTTQQLYIAGSTDNDIFTPLIHGFQQQYPDIAIHYLHIDTQDLYQAVIQNSLPQIDIIISSATDLQLRLVNDGYAKTHISKHTEHLPNWAQWRHSIFGFSLEPIVLVYSTQLNSKYRAKTRAEFLAQLENNPLFWRFKVGTYDIERSGLGYLLAVFDERLSSNFWGITNALGQVGARLYTSTSDILDDLDSGTLYAGYNLLGSYAFTRQQAGAAIDVVIPEDYVLVFSRTALIHHLSPQPKLAGWFVDYLLSDQGQYLITTQVQLGALIKDTSTQWPEQRLYESLTAPIQPITIAPSLLTGLDSTRKKRFIQNWIRLITDTPDDRSLTASD